MTGIWGLLAGLLPPLALAVCWVRPLVAAVLSVDSTRRLLRIGTQSQIRTVSFQGIDERASEQ